MTLRVRVLSGSRQGEQTAYDAPRITVGRHPESDLRFDPDEDRTVSARHAVLERTDRGWVVRDHGSRNGTYLNGERVDAPRPLRSGDRLRFGTDGPRVEVELSRPSSASDRPAETRPLDERSRRQGPGDASAAAGRDGIEARDRWLLAAAGLFLLTGLGAAYLFIGGPDGPDGEESPSSVGRRADSVLGTSGRTLDSLRGRVQGLEETLRATRRRAAAVRETLRRMQVEDSTRSGSGSDTEKRRRRLQERLRDEVTSLSRRQVAAEIDFSAIRSANWRALARVFVRKSGGVVTATAFGVRSNGLLVTSRHVVLEDDGSPAPEIGVQFARSAQVWPGALLATGDSVDLALLRVENVVGPIPVLESFNDRPDTLLGRTSPVALMGYSDTDSGVADAATSDRLPRPRITGGLLVGKSGRSFTVRGLGAQGGSGSPIFDARGQVVGVLRGGRRDAGEGRRLVAIPSSDLRSFLSTVLDRLAR